MNSLATFLAGAATVIITAYCTAKFQRNAAIEAERRGAARRRREARIEPVLSFLQAQRAAAGSDARTTVLLKLVERARSESDPEMWEAVQQQLSIYEAIASPSHALAEGVKAVLAAPSEPIVESIMAVLETPESAKNPGDLDIDELRGRVRRLETLVDEYLDAV